MEFNNPHVFLDVEIGGDKVGRIVIELYTNVVPETAYNFQALCSGERGWGKTGKRLHFKGSCIHKVIPQMMLQAGDIINNDGTGGESIYGEKFPDENFGLNHEAGVVSMANSGPNTNSSQFFIPFVDCPHLDGHHVVFGKVVKGLGVIKMIQKIPTENDIPLKKCIIYNCGEMLHSDFGLIPNDGTADIYPDYPEDASVNFSSSDVMKIIRDIKWSGNEFFHQNKNVEASMKYEKSLRYIDAIESPDKNEEITDLKISCLLNWAACKLKLADYSVAAENCTEVLKINPENVKALYRRGQANLSMRNYNNSLNDLKFALKLSPNNKDILNTLKELEKQILEYKEFEKHVYRKMFKI